jgi:hypothetical protein
VINAQSGCLVINPQLHTGENRKMGNPDCWVVMESPEGDHYRLLHGYSGSYLYGSSWNLNSGIVQCRKLADCFELTGSSGSKYRVNLACHGVSMATVEVFEKLLQRGWKQFTADNWEAVDWKIK